MPASSHSGEERHVTFREPVELEVKMWRQLLPVVAVVTVVVSTQKPVAVTPRSVVVTLRLVVSLMGILQRDYLYHKTLPVLPAVRVV